MPVDSLPRAVQRRVPEVVDALVTRPGASHPDPDHAQDSADAQSLGRRTRGDCHVALAAWACPETAVALRVTVIVPIDFHEDDPAGLSWSLNAVAAVLPGSVSAYR